VAPVKWRSGLRDLPNAVLATRECGNSRDSSLGRCIEVIQTVTDPLTRISVAIHYGRSPEAMNSRPRGQLASVSSTQSNRLMSLKDEIPPVEVSPSRDSSLGRCIEVIQTVTDPLTRISVAIQYGRSPEAMNSRPCGQLASVSSTQSNRLMSLKDEIPPAEVSPSQVSRYFDYPPT
jgi:hypothetical protein